MNENKDNKVIPILLGTFLTLNIIFTSINLITLAKKKKAGCSCQNKNK